MSASSRTFWHWYVIAVLHPWRCINLCMHLHGSSAGSPPGVCAIVHSEPAPKHM